MTTSPDLDLPGATPEMASDTTSRRKAITKLAAGTAAGATLWIAPSILSLDSPAAAVSCAVTPAPVALFAACNPQINTGVASGTTPCVVTFDSGNKTVLRKNSTQQMLLSVTNTGLQEPYVDGIARLTVTPSVGAAVVWRLVRWTNDQGCFASGYTNSVTLTSTEPSATVPAPDGTGACPPTNALAPVDITTMFGTSCGSFTVRIEVINLIKRSATSAIWVVPV